MSSIKRREFITLFGGAAARVAACGGRADLSIAPNHHRGTRAYRRPRRYARAPFVSDPLNSGSILGRDVRLGSILLKKAS